MQHVEYNKNEVHLYYTAPVVFPKDRQMNGICFKFANDDQICIAKAQIKQKMSELQPFNVQNTPLVCWNKQIQDTSVSKTIVTHYCLTPSQQRKFADSRLWVPKR